MNKEQNELNSENELSSGSLSLHQISQHDNSSQIENAYERSNQYLHSNNAIQPQIPGYQQNQAPITLSEQQQAQETSQATAEKDFSSTFQQKQTNKSLENKSIQLFCQICHQPIISDIFYQQKNAQNNNQELQIPEIICQNCFQTQQQQLTNLSNNNQQLEKLIQKLTPKIDFHFKIQRYQRKQFHQKVQFSDEGAENFPLLFDSEIDSLQWLEDQIKAEREFYIKNNNNEQAQDQILNQQLPSQKLICLQLIYYKILKYMNNNEKFTEVKNQLIEDLLIDITDDQTSNISVQSDYSCLVDIKKQLLIRQYQKALEISLQKNLYEISWLINNKYQLNQQNVISEKQNKYLEQKLGSQLIFCDNIANYSDNIYHLIGYYLLNDENIEIMKQLIDYDKEMTSAEKQILFITLQLPLLYESDFDYIKIYDEYNGVIQQNVFQQLLNKLNRQYNVPNIIELRLSECYEFSFAKRNQHITAEELNRIQILINSKYNSLYGDQQLFSLNLIKLPYFPHLLILKSALAGFARKYCKENPGLDQIMITYLEQIERNLNYLISYSQENIIQQQEDSDQFDETLSQMQIMQLPFKLSTYNVYYPFVARSLGKFGEVLKAIRSYKKELISYKVINYQELVQSLFINSNQENDQMRFLGEELIFNNNQNDSDSGSCIGSYEADGLEINQQFADEDSAIDTSTNNYINQQQQLQQQQQIQQQVQQQVQQQPFIPLQQPIFQQPVVQQKIIQQPIIQQPPQEDTKQQQFILSNEQNIQIQEQQNIQQPQPQQNLQDQLFMSQQSQQIPPQNIDYSQIPNDITFQSPSIYNREGITPTNNYQQPQGTTPALLQIPDFIGKQDAAPAFSDSENQESNQENKANEINNQQLENKEPIQNNINNQLEHQQQKVIQENQQLEKKQQAKQSKKQQKEDEPIVADLGKPLSRRWSKKYNAYCQIDENGNEIPPKVEEFVLPPTADQQNQQNQQQQELQQTNSQSIPQPIQSQSHQIQQLDNPFATPQPLQQQKFQGSQRRRYSSAMK